MIISMMVSPGALSTHGLPPHVISPETLDWVVSLWSHGGRAWTFRGYGQVNSLAPPPPPPPASPLWSVTWYNILLCPEEACHLLRLIKLKTAYWVCVYLHTNTHMACTVIMVSGVYKRWANPVPPNVVNTTIKSLISSRYKNISK